MTAIELTDDERSVIIAALECYHREQVRISVSLWRANKIKEAARLDKATEETKAVAYRMAWGA